MKMRKGDLSAPVLAIIVTIGVIAAGLALMSWFWWFAPTIGRTGMLMVVGQPVLVNATVSEKAYNLTIVLKNIGNTDIRIEGIVIKNVQCIITNNNVIGPGKTVVMRNIQCRNIDIPKDEYYIEGMLVTDAGTYIFSANVI
ncbi:MAG: hypothetical protein QXZ41_02870 [Ignisphaera sp.]